MIHFIVHGRDDTIGVLVTDVTGGQALTGWNMETDETLHATVNQDIPLGHKVALTSIPVESKIIKYGVPIGLATEEISAGQHVHTHNLRTARW